MVDSAQNCFNVKFEYTYRRKLEIKLQKLNARRAELKNKEKVSN